MTANEDAFIEGWREALKKWAPAARLTTAVLKLTHVGERPAKLTEIAALMGPSLDEASLTRLLQQLFPNRVTIEDGLVHLGVTTERPPAYRFELQIGQRHMYVGGCAPDQFWIAFLVDEPVEIRATCHATGEPIRVVVSHDKVTTVEPAEAVVALVDPAAIFSLSSADEFDANVCVLQPFFASKEAGSQWAAKHPEGRLFSIPDFFAFWRRELEPIIGDLMIKSEGQNNAL